MGRIARDVAQCSARGNEVGSFCELLSYSSENELNSSSECDDGERFATAEVAGMFCRTDSAGESEAQGEGSVEPGTPVEKAISGGRAGICSATPRDHGAVGITAIENLLSSAPVNVDKILEGQDALLSKRRMILSGSCRKRRKNGGSASRFQGLQTSRPLRMEDRWREYLLSLEEDFFTSAESRMEEEGKVGKGKPAYRGLLLQPENNADLKIIYELRYRTKHSLGQTTGSFDQLRIAAGQFARLYFTLTKKDPTEFYKRGKLFEAITELNISRALLGYLRLRGSPSTVASKSMHLKTLAEHAQTYFAGKNEELKGRAAMICQFLLSEAASEKREARRFSRQQKSTHERLLKGTMFSPADFQRCTEAAKTSLNGILGSFRKLQGEKGLKTAIEALLKNEKILQKWNINMIGLLLLSGGGQRPQVFSQLQLPTRIELENMKNGGAQMGYIEFRTVMEKTSRSFDMPNVVFPSNIFPFVDFHSRIVRPVMKRKLDVSEGSLEERTLLIDTRSGEPLSSIQISHTFRRFLSRIDEELTKVTPMALRGSYATMMLQSFRRGEVFKDKGEEEFLHFLAKAMNTSYEQLASTYAGNDMTDFEECARELTSVLAQFGGEDRVGSHVDPTVCNAVMSIWS